MLSRSLTRCRAWSVLLVLGCGARPAPTLPSTVREPCVDGSARPDASASVSVPPSHSALAPLRSVVSGDGGERVLPGSFDCFPADADKRTQSLRHWAAGGPEGAAWNVDSSALVCEVSLEAPCGGVVALRVLGGRKQLLERSWSVSNGANRLSFEVRSEAWVPAVEPSAAPYGLLLLSLGGLLSCKDASTTGRYLFADAFLAGFASGE